MSDVANAAWEELERILRQLVPLMRSQLHEQFPGMSDDVLRDCARDWLVEFLCADPDTGPATQQEMFDSICAAVRVRMS